jgi:hypothetical protein
MVGGPVRAAEPDIRLSLEPDGAPGTFFDLSLEPGDQRSLSVSISNQGTELVRARTYAADVYSIINGGLGARLRDEPVSGTTTWLDYPTEVFDLAAGQAAKRSIRLAVPGDIEPGEYITSVVIENDEPIAAGGDTGFQQVVRQALAIVVTVPGEMTAALELGDARHSYLADRSVVGVALDNVGDRRLEPSGTVAITDSAQAEIERIPIVMGSVYAGTNTFVEVVLGSALPTGHYFAVVDLEDEGRGARVNGMRPFVVGDPLDGESQLPPGSAAGPGQATIAAAPTEGNPAATAAALVALAIAIGVVLVVLFVVIRRRRKRAPAKP